MRLQLFRDFQLLATTPSRNTELLDEHQLDRGAMRNRIVLEGAWEPMRQSWKFMVLVAALSVTQAFVAPSNAALFNMQELVDGTSFDSPDGTLHFDQFTFEIVTDDTLSPLLSDYEVLVDAALLSDGFRLVGSILVGGGDSGQIKLGYEVTAIVGQITAAGLSFNGIAYGDGANASVLEEFFTVPGDAMLFDNNLEVFSLGASVSAEGPRRNFDFTTFDQTYDKLRIENDIFVTSDGGIFGSMSVVEQHFSTVPEPGTAALLGFGVIGVGISRWRKRH